MAHARKQGIVIWEIVYASHDPKDKNWGAAPLVGSGPLPTLPAIGDRVTGEWIPDHAGAVVVDRIFRVDEQGHVELVTVVLKRGPREKAKRRPARRRVDR